MLLWIRMKFKDKNSTVVQFSFVSLINSLNSRTRQSSILKIITDLATRVETIYTVTTAYSVSCY